MVKVTILDIYIPDASTRAAGIVSNVSTACKLILTSVMVKVTEERF